MGSVFSSVFGPNLVDALGDLPVPAGALDAAKESMAAALVVALRAPAEAQQVIADAARSSFVSGMQAGTLVAAGAAVLGAVLAVAFLPARSSGQLPE
jgi:hypothetical protein